jgi:hypothetical protein
MVADGKLPEGLYVISTADRKVPYFPIERDDRHYRTAVT